MTGYQMRQFGDPKPSLFPMRIDARPERHYALHETESEFDDVLNRQLDYAGSEGDPQEIKEKLLQKRFATKYSTLQAATLQKATDHLNLRHLADIEQAKQRANYERHTESNYVDYEEVLRNPVAASAGEIIGKRRKKVHDDTEFVFEEVEDGVVAEDYTYIHNMNLFKGVSTLNPFKKQDVGNFKEFEDNPFFHAYTQQFLSPLRILGGHEWENSNRIMSKIQDNSFKIKDAVDPYYDNKIDEFDIMANYNTIVTDPAAWNSWNQDAFFGFILRRWSDIKNYSKTIRTFAGRAMDATSSVDYVEMSTFLKSNPKKAVPRYFNVINQKVADLGSLYAKPQRTDADEHQLSLLKQDILAYSKMPDQSALSKSDKQQLNQLVNHIEQLKIKTSELAPSSKKESLLDKWWRQVAENLPNAGMLLPFGLMAETAELTSEEMDFGNWEDTLTSGMSGSITDESGGFIDLALSNYTEYIHEHYLTGFQGQAIVSEETFAVDNIDYGRAIFLQLSQNGFLDSSGRVTSKFEVNNLSQDLGLDRGKQENLRVQDLLRLSLQGRVSLDEIDRTVLLDEGRRNIRLMMPDGQSKTLSEVVQLIGSGQTTQEKYRNTRDAYNVFLDMSMSMSELTDSATPQQLTPQIKQVGKHQFELTIYPKGSWQELSPADSGESWQVQSGRPITLQFQTHEQASQFFTQVRQITAMLEPIVGTFDPVVEAGPGTLSQYYRHDGQVVNGKLRVLTDNIGELGDSGMVSEQSDSFGYRIDTIYHHTFFKTPEWRKISQTLGSRVSEKIGTVMFERNMVNRFSRLRHKRITKDYKDRKKKHQESEYSRIKEEMKRDSKRRAQQKRALKQAAARARQHRMELKKAEKQARMIEEKVRREAIAKRKREESRSSTSRKKK